MSEGIIFNIQKLSIHDGPGIRTVVFFKGCPLRCLWCANPESQKKEREIACFTNRCVECGYCENVCPQHAITRTGKVSVIDRDKCDLCEVCVKECCTNSKQVVGKPYSLDEVMVEILKDKPFYDESGGGVTFSGGEPLMQADFLLETLKACKEAGVNTAIETTGLGDLSKFLEAAKYLDLVFFDVKHMDSKIHEQLTGVPNERIHQHLRELAKVHHNIIARIPTIPGMNDSEENIAATAAFVSSLGIGKLELLPYHNFGEYKYSQMGMEYQLHDIESPSPEAMEHLRQVAQDAAKGTSMVCEVVEM